MCFVYSWNFGFAAICKAADCHRKVELSSYMTPLSPATDISTKLSPNRLFSDDNSNLCPGDPLMYFRTRIAASQWGFRGACIYCVRVRNKKHYVRPSNREVYISVVPQVACIWVDPLITHHLQSECTICDKARHITVDAGKISCNGGEDCIWDCWQKGKTLSWKVTSRLVKQVPACISNNVYVFF